MSSPDNLATLMHEAGHAQGTGVLRHARAVGGIAGMPLKWLGLGGGLLAEDPRKRQALYGASLAGTAMQTLPTLAEEGRATLDAFRSAKRLGLSGRMNKGTLAKAYGTYLAGTVAGHAIPAAISLKGYLNAKKETE